MRALITGATGQDGSYLAECLLQQGHTVYGMLRGQDHPRLDWLLTQAPGIRVLYGDLSDESSLRSVVATSKPDWIFNLAAVSSPSQAWQQPILTADVTGVGALRLFQVAHTLAPEAHIIQASSIATHGPYGAAKLFAHTVAQDYRSRGLHVSCAVFGGHHSPRRGKSFFARKVTWAVAQIAKGSREPLHVGPLTRSQDWGWAPDFMAQFPRLAELSPDDYVMSTGVPHSTQEWVQVAFNAVDLNWEDHVVIDASSGNITDVPTLTAAPDPRLKWEPKQEFNELVEWLVDSDLKEA